MSLKLTCTQVALHSVHSFSMECHVALHFEKPFSRKGDDISVQSTPFFAVSLLYVKISPYPDRGEDELIGPTSFPIPQNHSRE